jgi:hypothetical protein
MAKKKSSGLERQLKYLKTEKGKAATARYKAKPSKFQLSLLRQLKNNGKIRVTINWGLQAVMLDRNDKVSQNRISINTIELLSSDSGKGKLLKVISKNKDEIIYGISKKGLQVLDKELSLL